MTPHQFTQWIKDMCDSKIIDNQEQASEILNVSPSTIVLWSMFGTPEYVDFYCNSFITRFKQLGLESPNSELYSRVHHTFLDSSHVTIANSENLKCFPYDPEIIKEKASNIVLFNGVYSGIEFNNSQVFWNSENDEYIFGHVTDIHGDKFMIRREK